MAQISSNSTPVLDVRDITKTFPGVKALDGVNFTLLPGEIHALMGENGAGKSTFINILTGVYRPDGGTITLHGTPVEFHTPQDARRHSIAAIYQQGTAYPHLSITENIFLGHELKNRFHLLDWTTMHARASALLQRLGSHLDPHTEVGELTVAEQQVVEIAKAISTEANIIIMDEPTAALSKRECQELYRITEQLRQDGCSIIFISHRLEDIHRLADRITVFRDARYIGTWNASDIRDDELITAMVGREIKHIFPQRQPAIGSEVFRLEHFSRTGYFRDISLAVRHGEILAVTGLVGAGRSEVFCSVFGIDRPDHGELFLEGRRITIRSPKDAMKQGIGFLPEDRLRQGLFLDWSIARNITLPTLANFSRLSILRPQAEHARARQLAEDVTVKTNSVFAPASSLSGGNQQKVVVAKILNLNLKVLILDEPTKGVDVGAKSQIYDIIADLAARGYGIIMISSELPEVLGLADTIAVMRDGTLSAVFPNSPAVTQETILQAALTAG